jgi:GTP1/Obg family GTP-binding protein
LALLATGPALAQEGQQSGSATDPAMSGAQDTSFSDQELSQFVDAQEGINGIRDEYMEKIESADSQQKAQELQMEANDEMVSVIEDAGIDVPTYNSIATAYNSQPEVRNRVDEMM